MHAPVPCLALACLGILLADSCAAQTAQIAAAQSRNYADKRDLLNYLDADGKFRRVKTRHDWAIRAGHVLENMQSVMGPLPAAGALPLAVEYGALEVLPHYTRRHITFAVEKDDRLPAYLLVPNGADGKAVTKGSFPAVICLPGSSPQGKEGPAGLDSGLDRAYAHELAMRGYVCLVLDYPLLHTREYKTDPYRLGYVSATMKGVVNHRRGVDLLESLPFVDREAVGAIGHSLGGHNALFLAAFDHRIKAVVSSCGFNTFAKYYSGNLKGWSSRYYMPRIQTAHGNDPARMPFDFTEVLAVLAPRAVFVNAPLHDHNFEVSGVRDCMASALPVYRNIFGAADRLVVHYPDAGHTFPSETRQKAYAFLDSHLLRRKEAANPQTDLVGHWYDGKPGQASLGSDAKVREVALGRDGSAEFNGRSSFAEVALKGGSPQGDWSVAAWVNTPSPGDDVPGDIVSSFDHQNGSGFHLSIKTNAGITHNQANYRQLQFGIDNGGNPQWVDCGRPGKAILAFALAVHEGYLYAGTCEPGRNESGRVYRYRGNQEWIDCGAPDASNAVTALAAHQGKLYAGTGKYRLAGSALPESENTRLGGRVFSYDGGGKWTDCGRLPEAEAVSGMVVFRGKLYASSLYRPAGFYRYEGGTRWTSCETPGGKRVEALGVYNGFLYATSYDGAHVYRFDGQHWTDCGRLGDNTQTYALAIYRGRLHVGTWPSGRVYRFEDINRWTDVGRLGNELEVMGMLVHGTRLYAGTLPLAEIYTFGKASSWQCLAVLDQTPHVKYRRAWTMAEYQGRLYCSTLPSGRIFSLDTAGSVSWDYEFPTGWRHVAAVKAADRLELYVDGELVARSPARAGRGGPPISGRTLQIGFGPNDYFHGRLRDVRLYGRTLNAAEIHQLARPH